MTRAVWFMASAACLAAAAMAGCSKAPQPPKGPAVRVVCFSPAVTRILFDMHLGDVVVGVTRFAKLPPGVERPRVGDALNINAEAVLALRPTVIFAQTTPDKFRGVREIDPTVQIVEVELETLADLSAVIERIGRIVGRTDLAAETRAAFAARIRQVTQRVADRPRPRVLFVMGTDRPVAAGPDNFMGDLIAVAGGVNAGADIPGNTRWRPTHIEAILKAAPDVLIGQVDSDSEVAKARQYWLKWKDLPAATAGRVYVVSDPTWSIPSTHLAEVASELAEILHPSASIGPASGPASRPATGGGAP